MATRLTILNNVLRKLRETEATTVTDTSYTKLLGQFINDGLAVANESHDWSAYEHSLVFDVSNGTFEYDLSATVANGGAVDNASTVTNETSQLRFDDQQRPLSFLYDSSSSNTRRGRMLLISEDERTRRRSWDLNLTNQNPVHFSIKMQPDGDGWKLSFWPTPNTARHVRMFWTTPQAELLLDSTDDATEIILPRRIVELYAYMMALNERGEELGEPGNLAERNWERALGAAMEQEISIRNRTNELDSFRD